MPSITSKLISGTDGGVRASNPAALGSNLCLYETDQMIIRAQF